MSSNKRKKIERKERNRVSKIRKKQRKHDRENKMDIANLQATYHHLVENGMIEDINGIMPIDLSIEFALHYEEEEIIRLEEEARKNIKKCNSE